MWARHRDAHRSRGRCDGGVERSRRTARGWLPTPSPGLRPPGSSACPSSELVAGARLALGLPRASPSGGSPRRSGGCNPRPSDRPETPVPVSSLAGILGRRDVRRWAVGELARQFRMGRDTVFSGALFTERYGPLDGRRPGSCSPSSRPRLSPETSSQLGAIPRPCAKVPCSKGAWQPPLPSLSPGRSRPPRSSRLCSSHLQHLCRPATRTVAGTVYGFAIAGDLSREVGSIRASTNQIGYLIGSLVGGAALTGRWLCSVVAGLRWPLPRCDGAVHMSAGDLPSRARRGDARRIADAALWSAPAAGFAPPLASARPLSTARRLRERPSAAHPAREG